MSLLCLCTREAPLPSYFFAALPYFLSWEASESVVLQRHTGRVYYIVLASGGKSRYNSMVIMWAYALFAGEDAL